MINIFRSKFPAIPWASDNKAKKVTISSFLILSIYKIQQLACWFINQLHSDAEAAQRQEEHEACFFVMGPPYRNRAKQNQKKRQMGDQINLQGSFLEAEEPCLNLPVTVEGQHGKHRAKIGKKKPRLAHNLILHSSDVFEINKNITDNNRLS